MQNNLTIVVAAANNNGIGFQNTIPWHNKEDLQHFKNYTLNKACIMGFNTFLSLKKPLPNRLNVVLTSKNIEELQRQYVFENLRFANDVENALQIANAYNDKEICIIGGAKIYQQFLDKVNKIVLSKINESPTVDAFFIFDKDKFTLYESTQFASFDLEIYIRNSQY